MTRIVDLRSDTLTLPTDEMRRVMAAAEVGDDQYAEDPTVARLEALAAEKVGKDAALLVMSGTMGNLVAALTHTRPGDEVIVDLHSHFYNAEVGGLAALAGLMSRQLVGGRDGLDPAEVEAAIRPPISASRPRTGLIVIENPSNRGGGAVMPIPRMSQLAQVAARHGIPIHLDGARLFNAVVALARPPADITAHVTSLQFCLTKGLSAPVGSILAGDGDFIDRARRVRQMVGGGWRQAGVVAAAGIVALETMVDRLAEDHANARVLAEGAVRVAGLAVDLQAVQTNMVYIDFGGLGLTGAEVVTLLEGRGVRAIATAPTVLRFVTYRGIGRADVEYAVEQLAELARYGPGGGPPAADVSPAERRVGSATG